MRLILFGIWLTICLIVGSCSDSKPNDLEFVSSAWKEGNARTRGQMLSKLRERNILLGRTREFVIGLLGDADHDEQEFMKYEVDNGQNIYKVVVSRMYLIIEFDKAGGTVTGISMADG
ncbi:MAG: hypothetical protein WBD22_14340 [Pyrinomonadaceae bacterium]